MQTRNTPNNHCNTSHTKQAYWLQHPAVMEVFTRFQQAGVDIRLVGGSVRDCFLPTDAMLENIPATDWDFATTALPDTAMDICNRAGFHVVPTGLKHGTITAVYQSTPFEITTLRIDSQTNGRHSQVVWTDDWYQDSLRRDFTINALYGDVQGYIYDYHGGLNDLSHSCVRFIGDAQQRIVEDHLRILRYFRFLSRFGHIDQLDLPSFEACKQSQHLLTHISAERIQTELFKLLSLPYRAVVVRLMQSIGIFETLCLPVIPHAEQILMHLQAINPSALLAFASILDHHTDWHPLKQRLKLSNQSMQYLLFVQSYCLQFAKGFTHLQLRIAYDHAQRKGFANPLAIIQDIYTLLHQSTYHGDVIRWDDCITQPLPITGGDLMYLGIAEGAQITILLKQLQQIYAESDFSLTKDALIQHAIRLKDKIS